MKSVSDSLAGRASVVELEPLSFAEARRRIRIWPSRSSWCAAASPSSTRTWEIESEDFLRSYVATYLERDLRQLLQVLEPARLRTLLRAAALRTAQLLNRADLVRDVGISGSTAGAWLSALEASHQLVLLSPGSRPDQVAREAAQAVSARCRACGVSCGVHTTQALHSSPLAGALWETLVCSEIRRAQSNRRGGWDLNFWRKPYARSRLSPASGGGLPSRGRQVDRAPGRPRRQGAAQGHPRAAGRSGSSMSIFCRAPNAYPIGAGDVQAVPLAMPAGLEGWI